MNLVTVMRLFTSVRLYSTVGFCASHVKRCRVNVALDIAS